MKGAFPFFLRLGRHEILRPIIGRGISIGIMMMISAMALASQVVEDFSSRTQRGSSTATWNQELGFLMPPVQVTGWDDGTAHDTEIDLGDGRHGAFDSSTWSRFSSSVDSGAKIIYLDNDTYYPFQFTSFDLPTGWTIRPSGQRELLIYVQGNMVVNGIINCSGDNGASSTGSGALAVAGSGGRGRCGGASGGNGGSRYTGLGTGSGVAGSAPDGSLTGGNPGITSVGGFGGGGGGGGAWTSLNIPNIPATVSGAGSRGTNFYNPSWTKFMGSAGGGGGAGNANEAGGGGGGGGGLIDIHVGGDLTLGADGLVLANGGDGGNTPGQGGAGGAGGGGSVRTWVAGTMTLSATSPPAPSEVIQAQSGSVSTPASGGRGGSGWAGRTWVTSGNFISDATNPTTIGPSSQLTSFPGGEGTIAYLLTPDFEAESAAIDTGSTLPSFRAANVTTNVPSKVTVEFAGSDDGFASDNSGWVSATNIAQLNNKRFIKFRATIVNNNATTPVTIDKITVDYTMGTKTDFDFKSSGCGFIGSAPQPPSAGFYIVILLFLSLPLIVLKKHRRKIS